MKQECDHIIAYEDTWDGREIYHESELKAVKEKSGEICVEYYNYCSTCGEKLK